MQSFCYVRDIKGRGGGGRLLRAGIDYARGRNVDKCRTWSGKSDIDNGVTSETFVSWLIHVPVNMLSVHAQCISGTGVCV